MQFQLSLTFPLMENNLCPICLLYKPVNRTTMAPFAPFLLLLATLLWGNAPETDAIHPREADLPDALYPDTLSTTIASAMQRFLDRNRSFNPQTVFFLDMKIPANRYRFFVYDIGTKKILHRGLVAQGINTQPDARGRLRFSNETGSYCTSLGRYRIGQKYKGRFGTAYKLHGLDSSNSNAYRRAIVLHKFDDMPDTPGGETVYSLGCPMVSPQFFTTVSRLIDQSEAPILLQISY